MRDKIKEHIRLALNARNESYFTREKDIQIYLAKYLEDTNEFDRVFIECYVPANIFCGYPWNDSKKIYIDLVVELNGFFCPIEVKYKTTSQELPIKVFGTKTTVSLGNQRAKNIGCYDFWKDIKRLELLQSISVKVEKGIMLFVTNDMRYKNEPRNNSVGYFNFSVHDKRFVEKDTPMMWNKKVEVVAHNRPSITLNNNYKIIWQKLPLDNHYYVLI